MKILAVLTGTRPGPFPSRDILAVQAYLNRERSNAKCVDGTLSRDDIQLAQRAAAARMQ